MQTAANLGRSRTTCSEPLDFVPDLGDENVPFVAKGSGSAMKDAFHTLLNFLAFDQTMP